jgi:shikimate kinase
MKSIFLIGMMGAGKTTVGRRLAAQLGLKFVDADHVLVERCGVSIPVIFEHEGEAGFRKRETSIIDELSQCSDIVLSTGGGVVVAEQNRRCLAERGTVIYLRATMPELWLRTKRDKRRPMLQSANPRRRMEELFAARREFYELTAHHTIDTGRFPVDSVVASIVQSLAVMQEPSALPNHEIIDLGDSL